MTGTVFGATIFLGAFLLFQVQLVIGKYILPWYGGVPAVWTTCMLVFQLLLLAGYAYAHLLVRRLPEARQRVVHLFVVGASFAIVGALIVRWGIPLLPSAAWKPSGAESPTGHIVGLLLIAVGAPFFVASTTSPLIQAWFGKRFPGRSPYRLYALSNAGSLLALVTYPTMFEIWLPLRAQAWLWAALFMLFVSGVFACALSSRTRGGVTPTSGAAPSASADPAATATPTRPRAADYALWTTLAAVPSALLLATTNYMSQEVAVVPMLWIVPLSLYLLSFVLTFDSERWYARGAWATLLALGVTLSTFVLERGINAHVLLQIGVAALALFAACMVCHGELARLKPAPAYLTGFYLALTVGGAVGGAFVSLAAPVLFPGTWEYPLGLWLAAALTLLTFHRDRRSPYHTAPAWVLAGTTVSAAAVTAYVFRERLPWTLEIRDPWLFGVPVVVTVVGFAGHAWLRFHRRKSAPAGAARAGTARPDVFAALALVFNVLVLGVVLAHLARAPLLGALQHSRSFYGIVHVEAIDSGGDRHVVHLRHGRITHGAQYRAPKHAREPTAYYGRDSGIGLAIEQHPRRATGLRIGVVGLGVGTLAAYGERGDTIRFYELNPDVSRLSGHGSKTFTFVADSPATIDIVVGDARLAMEAELARGAPQRFDVLAIDAFSSDAIPAHLLTREAVEVYLEHLDPGGILALHITNRYVALEPVVRGIAHRFGLAYAFVVGSTGPLTWRNDWALLSRDPSRLSIPPIKTATSFDASDAPIVVWTDDYSNLLRLLK